MASDFTLPPSVFAGCCVSLLGVGRSRCYLLNLCIGAWTHTSPRFSGAFTRFFPENIGLTLSLRGLARKVYRHNNNFYAEQFSRLQSFTNVQAHEFARHPDCSYRSESLFRLPSMSLRVQWLFQRFRSGPQSDSHSTLQYSGNPPGSRGFYFRAYLGSLPPQAADILTVRFRATDGRGTFTLQDSQPCRLLR